MVVAHSFSQKTIFGHCSECDVIDYQYLWLIHTCINILFSFKTILSEIYECWIHSISGFGLNLYEVWRPIYFQFVVLPILELSQNCCFWDAIWAMPRRRKNFWDSPIVYNMLQTNHYRITWLRKQWIERPFICLVDDECSGMKKGKAELASVITQSPTQADSTQCIIRFVPKTVPPQTFWHIANVYIGNPLWIQVSPHLSLVVCLTLGQCWHCGSAKKIHFGSWICSAKWK